MSTLRIFLVTIIIISCYCNIFISGVYAQSENHSINSLLGTVNKTVNSIREGLSDLPKNFEYTIDIDTKEVFRNSIVKENVLNKYEPIEYSIPLKL